MSAWIVKKREGSENRRNGERGSLPFALHCIMGFERIKGKGQGKEKQEKE